MFEIVTSEYFLRRSQKFLRKHPELKAEFEKALEILYKDPWHPKLKLHPLKGDLKGLHAISLTFSFRITLVFKVVRKEIILIDIGSHDEVY